MLETSPGGAFLDVTVPGGTGWKANGKSTKFTYTNKAGFQGITKIKVTTPPKKPGQVKFHVKGKNVGFVDPPALPVKGTFVIDSPNATTGQCGETGFATSACKRNGKGSKLTCK